MGLRRTARSFRDALCVLDRVYAEVVGKFLFSVRKGSSPFWIIANVLYMKMKRKRIYVYTSMVTDSHRLILYKAAWHEWSAASRTLNHIITCLWLQTNKKTTYISLGQRASQHLKRFGRPTKTKCAPHRCLHAAMIYCGHKGDVRTHRRHAKML